MFCLLIVSILLTVHSCENKRTDVDVDDVVINKISIDRMEQDVFNIDTNNIMLAGDQLHKKYGTFFNTYLKGILNNGGAKDSASMLLIKRFIHDRDMREAYNDTRKLYSNIEFLEEEMNSIFKHYKYHFPERQAPRVITMMSGFNYGSIYSDSILAIGLEMYLGNKSKFYPMLGLPVYRMMFMNKENIAVDAFRTWMFTEFPYNMNKSDFLSDVIFLGKILYLNDAMLPEVNDTLKIQYTQNKWNTANKMSIIFGLILLNKNCYIPPIMLK